MINGFKYTLKFISIVCTQSLAMILLAQNDLTTIYPEVQCNAVDHQASVEQYLQRSSQDLQPLRTYARSLALDYTASSWMLLKRSFPEISDHIDYELHQAVLWANVEYQKCASRTACEQNASWLQTKQKHALQDYNGTWQEWQDTASDLGKQGLVWLDQQAYAGKSQSAMSLMHDTLTASKAPTSMIDWAIKVFGEVTVTFTLGATEQKRATGSGMRLQYDQVTADTKQALQQWMDSLQTSSAESQSLRKWGISAAMMSLLLRENNDFVQNIKLDQLARQVAFLIISENMIQVQEFLRRATHTQLGAHSQVSSFIQHTQTAMQNQWTALQMWHNALQLSAQEMFAIASDTNVNLH